MGFQVVQNERMGSRVGYWKLSSGLQIETPYVYFRNYHQISLYDNNATITNTLLSLISLDYNPLIHQLGNGFISKIGNLKELIHFYGAIILESGFKNKEQNYKVSTEGILIKDKKDVLLTPHYFMELGVQLGAEICLSLENNLNLDISFAQLEYQLRNWSIWNKKAMGFIRKQQTHLIYLSVIPLLSHFSLLKRFTLSLVDLGVHGYVLAPCLKENISFQDMLDNLQEILTLLPKDKIKVLRYSAAPLEVFDLVAKGIDVIEGDASVDFANRGNLFTQRGILKIKKTKYLKDKLSIDPSCKCFVCQNYTRGYLCYLYNSKDTSFVKSLGVIHNLFFYNQLMKDIRFHIFHGTLESFYQDFKQRFSI